MEQSDLKVIYQWLIKSKVDHQRGMLWYIVMTSLAIALFVYSIFTANFLFAIMIILVIFIVILRDYMPTKDINFIITNRGLIVGEKFMAYKDISEFYIIYEPPTIKKLYFNPKGIRPEFSIELYDNNPIEIREYLLKVLREDLEKESESTSDFLERMFKL